MKFADVALKIYALSFRGAGRSHYAKEALNIIHHVQKVWPASLRDLVLNNWLINTSGHPNSWIGLDHHQEHNNLFTKTIYKAHGSNASWFWLATISPCVEALRALKKNLNSMFGRRQGSTHTSPDLTLDIDKLMRSLKTEKIYCLQPGRIIKGKDGSVIDAESVGLRALLGGKHPGLKEYNKSFKLTQEAYRLPTVFEMTSRTSLPQHTPGSVFPPTPREQNPRNGTVDPDSDSDVGSEEENSESEKESEEDFETQEGLADIDFGEEGLGDEFFAQAGTMNDEEDAD